MSPTSAEVDVDTVTIGEVNRNVSRLFDQVEKLTETVSDRPTWHDLRAVEDRATENRKAIADEVAALRNWQTWAIRAILGALIVGAVGLLFVVSP